MNWPNTPFNTHFGKLDERAVSPVIGVILMVAVTVILAAVVSMLVLGMGGDVQSHPQASFSFDYDAGTDELTISHEGGDSLNDANVNVTIAGTSNAWAGGDPITAGDEAVYTTASSGDTVRVVWNGPNGDSATLATYKVP